jgi:cell wall assembly regulator SMI1
MAIRVEQTKTPLSEADIAAFEQRTGLRLPPQYRDWLLQHNGGTPKPAGFRYRHETGPYTDSCVAWFQNIGPHRYENLEGTIRVFRDPQEMRVPDDLLPFARDPGGNLICIGLYGENEGKVYFWDHEEETVPPSYRNCHLVADSFDEFINGLH